MKNLKENTRNVNTEVIGKLNELLADYQIFYQNLRGLHWNIKGIMFFPLHEKFEEFYNEAATIVDEIAERILTVGGVPLHTFSAYLKSSEIKPEENVTDGQEALKVVLSNSTHILSQLNEINSLVSETGDEGTIDLITGLISSTEKRVWMLKASLS